MKRVAIIGTAGVPGRYGGFETLAHQLVGHLGEDHQLTVYCSGKLYKKEERVKRWRGARLVYLPLSANGLQSIPYDILSIIHALFFNDTLLILGVSGGIFLPIVKLLSNKKIIVNIDGLEWRRPKWHPLIRRFLKLSERLAVRFSDADITDNYALQQYTANEYKTLSILIEYGADHVSHVAIGPKMVREFPFLRQAYAFGVCRIEPENNIHVILEAFAGQEAWPLVMVGNWANSLYGQDLRKQYGHLAHLHLLDPIYEQQRLDALRSNCRLYVHGHSAGGTNPSLVEAMYLGLPVLAYDVSYNRHTTHEAAYYFDSSESLRAVMQETSDSRWAEAGYKLKGIADRHYTWGHIASRYKSIIAAFDFQYRKKRTRSVLSRLSGRELTDWGLAHQQFHKAFYE